MLLPSLLHWDQTRAKPGSLEAPGVYNPTAISPKKILAYLVLSWRLLLAGPTPAHELFPLPAPLYARAFVKAGTARVGTQPSLPLLPSVLPSPPSGPSGFPRFL